MGLAASQARFLAITARKADCEFRSMQIAQNKLSVTREMELATQDYQNAMNATKMVWDYDGDQSYLMDISYGLLMTPSYLNNYNPYLITNRGGQVIVDSKIAAAAKDAGIDAKKGGSRNFVNMYKFLDNLEKQGIISGATRDNVADSIGLRSKAGEYDPVTSDAGLTRYSDDGYLNWWKGGLNDAQKEAFYSYVAKNGITINDVTYTAKTPQEMKEKIGNLQVESANSYMSGMTVEEVLKQNTILDKNNSNGGIVTINGINYVIDFTNNSVKTGGVYNKSKTLKCSYDPNAGYGAEPMSKNEYVDTGLVGLTKRIEKGLNGSKNLKSSMVSVTRSGNTSTQISLDGTNAIVAGYASGTKFVDQGSTKSTITLNDILRGDVCMVSTLADGNNTYDNKDGAYDGIHDDVSAFFKDAANQIAKALGYNSYEDNDALRAAYNFTVKQYGISVVPSERSSVIKIGTAGSSFEFAGMKFSSCGSVGEVQNAVEKAANAYNGIVFMDQPQSGTSYNAVAGVNLSHLMGYFLTAFDSFTTGWASNYAIDTRYEDSFFITQDPDFRFAVLSEETETDQTKMTSDFYMQLFNNLCINGYVVDQDIKDNKYLEQMLENGAYYLCGINSDGYFYQARYSDDVRTLIKVVNDEDARTRAESEYNYQKMRLTAKEDRLDLEMKNIDMEIASLTTEYDSVKNLISKSIEKTFKQFDG